MTTHHINQCFRNVLGLVLERASLIVEDNFVTRTVHPYNYAHNFQFLILLLLLLLLLSDTGRFIYIIQDYFTYTMLRLHYTTIGIQSTTLWASFMWNTVYFLSGLGATTRVVLNSRNWAPLGNRKLSYSTNDWSEVHRKAPGKATACLQTGSYSKARLHPDNNHLN